MRVCARCDRTILLGHVEVDGELYHVVCAPQPTPPLTEADVRRIAREELERAITPITEEK